MPLQKGPDMWLITFVALLLGLPVPTDGQDRLADQLRKGIVQEEANGSVEKAIPIYQAIVTQFDQDRQAVATALFRLGECYRKAGKREPAVAAYQRVLREFGNQAALVASSRKQLQAYGVADTRAAREGDEIVQLRTELAAARKAEEAARSLQTARYDNPSPATSGGSSTVEEIGAQVASLDKRVADVLAKVKAGVLPQSELQQVTEQYQAALIRYREARREYEVQQKLMQETIKSVEMEILLVQKRIADIEQRVAMGVVATNDAELLQMKRDLLSLQRKLAELQAGVRR
jgi:tetratricopeptide (TPR) repeat protein